MEAIRVDLPYPEISGIGEDYCSAMIISPAYAGLYSELTAILQYEYKALFMAKNKREEDAASLEGIALAEMEHLHILGELLLELGVAPIYTLYPPRKTNFYNTTAVSTATEPTKILLDAISGELKAIADYNSMISRLCNQRVQAIIQRIVLDEELHVRVLKKALEGLNQPT